MNDQDKRYLEKLARDLAAERDSEIAAVRLKYERKMEAFSVLLDGPVIPFKQPEHASEPNSLLEAVRLAIKHHVRINGQETTFTVITLQDFISKEYPKRKCEPSDLSNPLWQLRTKGEIEIVKKGEGRIPSVYKLAQGKESTATAGGAS